MLEKYKKYNIIPAPLDKLNTHISSVLKELAELSQANNTGGIGDQKGKAFQAAM